MSSNTPNLSLRKPDPSDLVDVTADLSENMDKIDTAVAGKAATAHDHDADYEASGATAAHSADTTSVHGITDTSALETTSGATTKVADHSADTTSIHGITDTTALATASSVTSAVSTHAGLGDPHPGYVLESLIDAAGDLIVGTADNTVGRLAKGAALDVLRVNAGGTALEYAAPGQSGTSVLARFTVAADITCVQNSSVASFSTPFKVSITPPTGWFVTVMVNFTWKHTTAADVPFLVTRDGTELRRIRPSSPDAMGFNYTDCIVFVDESAGTGVAREYELKTAGGGGTTTIEGDSPNTSTIELRAAP